MANTLGLIVLCYFLGSIPFSYLVPRTTRGVDIRKIGSGNVGATNVLRNMGWVYGVTAMALDVAKGILAAYLAAHWGHTAMIASLGAAAAVLGHCYSPFIRFAGGKGVATTGGVVIFIMPWVALVLAAFFVLMVFIKRYVSLGSILTAAALPVAAYLSGQPLSYVWLTLGLAFFVIYKHRPNIERLLAGTEPKLGEKAGNQ